MKKYRLFVSVALDKIALRRLGYVSERVSSALPPNFFRVLDKNLWHITVLFLGDQDEEDLGVVVSGLEELARRFEPIEGRLKSVDYSRDEKMVWAYGDDSLSSRLGQMRDELQDVLIERGLQFRPENRRFIAHATLGRADRGGSERIALPRIKEGVDLGVFVDKVDLMSSVLADEGPKYEKLGEFWLDSRTPHQ